MIDEVYSTMKESVEKSKDALKNSLSRVRTGRANPAILDAVRVDYYGAKTPLNQLATISTPEPRMIVIKPFDRTIVGEIEKAIQSADLGLNPSSDAELIRLPVPPLTDERRKDLVKMVKKSGEESKIAIRNHRRDCNSLLKDLETSGDAPKDDVAKALKKIQDMTDAGIADVDNIIDAKEKEISEI
ncbi:MAG: ribosome recycling factor [Deltaproteobacteria bacterium]|nr:ribosome recycling factor [Deltaproteobacteria bacterium]MBN2672465.1 ribosome recycling factor [Deltaproteobacteria bacterium]